MFISIPEIVGDEVGVQFNHFGEQHGKSQVDQHFSVLTQKLEMITLRTELRTITDLKNNLAPEVPISDTIFTKFIIYNCDKRDTMHSLTCKYLKTKKKISMSCYHRFEKVNGQILVSILSHTSCPREVCTFRAKTEQDKRKLKFAPPGCVGGLAVGELPVGPKQLQYLTAMKSKMGST